MSEQGPGNVLKVNELMKEQEEIDIDAVLAERGKVHGDYEDHALYTQSIKDIIRLSDNYHNDMSPHQRETLDMIAHKIGRILAGDPNHKDHWIDIAGYAKLTADRL